MSGRPVDPSVPVLPMSFGLGGGGCRGLASCDRYVDNIRRRLVGRYFAEGEPFDGQVCAALLDLRGLTYDDYIANVRKQGKGAALRQARKADREGFVCKPFVRRMHIPDIVEINHSKEFRAGGAMREAYLKSVQEMGGAPKARIAWTPPDCPRHCDCWWGAFAPADGHAQGDVVTNEKLLAYIDLRRIGNMAFYSLILGHGDYLKFGIMYRLHFQIMQWICAREDEATKGLDFLMYAGFHQGTDGLKQWKKKTGFHAGYVVLSEATPAVETDRPGLWRRIRRLIG